MFYIVNIHNYSDLDLLDIFTSVFIFTFPVDAVAHINAYYGQGTGPILLDDVSCTGTEGRLVSCPYDSNTADCSHSEDAGVRCNNSCKQH